LSKLNGAAQYFRDITTTTTTAYYYYDDDDYDDYYYYYYSLLRTSQHTINHNKTQR